jgi:hypothetical protein
VTHRATSRFWSCYNSLSPEIQRLADQSYELLKADPRHPSLHFKKVGRFWSVRVGAHHRALSVATDNTLLWFWIGRHDEYDRLIRSYG